MLRCIPCSEEDEVTAFKKSFVVTHFHTARLTSPKPPKHVLQPPFYYGHC